MHTIKIKILYTMIIFASLGWHHTSHALFGFQKEATIISEATKAVSDKIVEGNLQTAALLSEGLSETTAQVVAASNTLAEKTAEVADKLSGVADKITGVAAVVGTVAGIGICVNAAIQVYGVGKDVASYVSPSNEQKARALNYQEQYETLSIKRGLRACLIQAVNSERGSSGRPIACEEAARMFAIALGDQELDILTKTFNKHYRTR